MGLFDNVANWLKQHNPYADENNPVRGIDYSDMYNQDVLSAAYTPEPDPYTPEPEPQPIEPEPVVEPAPEIMSPKQWLAQQEQQRILDKGTLSPQEWLAQQQEKPTNIYDTIGKAAGVIKEPAAAALEFISNFNRPGSALANAVVYSMQKDAENYRNNPEYQALIPGYKFANLDKPQDASMWDAVKRGFIENNGSYKPLFDPAWTKEHPVLSSVADVGMQVGLDPLWVAPPAKVASVIGKASKVVGLTDKLAPVAKAVAESNLGRKVIAGAEDFMGVKRAQDAADTFKAGRATDQVIGQDIVDEVKGFKKQYGDDASKLNDYIEAAERGENTISRPQEVQHIVNGARDGSLAKDIKGGLLNKDEAFTVLRDAGEEIPDYLLQEHQRVAKAAGEAMPDTVYRDQVLGQIDNEGLRNTIKTIGDKFIELNKKYSDALYDTGRLSDAQHVRFSEGSHLRRSMEKWDNAESFLKDLRENGTAEEFAEAYKDLARQKSNSLGFGAGHKVDTKQFIGRQVLSDETLRKMKMIQDPEYRLTDTLNRSSKALREEEYLQNIAEAWGKGADEAATLSRDLPKSRQYVPIPEGPAYGALAGKWVPADIAKQVLNLTGTGAQPSELAKSWQKMVSWWKVEKLAAPAAVMRNFYSGLPMANVFGQVPIQSIPKQMGKVVTQFTAKGGKNSPLIRELRQTGLLDTTWTRQELANILENPKGITKIADWGMKAFGAPDDFWKSVVYSYHRDMGKTVEEAAKIAKNSMLDYSQAPDWINSLAKTGIVPFAKFPFLAGKQTVKALYERPAQVTKYFKAQNQVNNEDREKIMPDYLKARTLLPIGEGTRIVNGNTQKVQNNIDLSYILPFANDVSFSNPIVDAAILAKTGKNGIGQQVIKPGMTTKEQVAEWLKWGYNTLGPSMPLPGNYAGEKLKDGWQGNVDSKGRQYDLPSAIAQTIFGIKNVPINTDEIAQQKIKSIEYQMKDVKARESEIKKNKNLSIEQRKEQIGEHQSQYKQLGKELNETKAAYNRLKRQEKGKVLSPQEWLKQQGGSKQVLTPQEWLKQQK